MESIFIPEVLGTELECFYPLFELLKNGIVVTDINSLILYVNPAYEKVTGYLKDEVIGQSPGMMRSGYHDEAFYKNIWDSLKNPGFWNGEIWNRNKKGHLYATFLNIMKVQKAGDPKICYLGVFSDISILQSSYVEKLNFSCYDFLTGLPNLMLLGDYFNKNIKIQDKSQRAALIFLDIDKFKKFNDEYGYLNGDKLLMEVTRRLQDLTPQADLITRIGADKFVLILRDIFADDKIENYCDTIKQAFAKPFVTDNTNVTVTCSIGVSIYPDSSEDFNKLLSIAEANSRLHRI